jgi:hypothetical protein
VLFFSKILLINNSQRTKQLYEIDLSDKASSSASASNSNSKKNTTNNNINIRVPDLISNSIVKNNDYARLNEYSNDDYDNDDDHVGKKTTTSSYNSSAPFSSNRQAQLHQVSRENAPAVLIDRL